MAIEPEKWWFTFGVDHPVRSKCYVVLEGCWSDARACMIRFYGNKWSHQYESAEAAGVERYSLRELTSPGMYELLSLIRKLPLRPSSVEAFLIVASSLVIGGELTIDDWTYVTRLIAFRIEKQRKEHIDVSRN